MLQSVRIRSRRIQPVGSQVESGICLAGHTWTLWKGPNANWEVLSFVSEDGDITEFDADLKEFFDYIVENQGVSSSQVSCRALVKDRRGCMLTSGIRR